MDIIEYDAGYKEAFIRFNTDWITDNFGFLEKEDLETFENIEKEIAEGAMIFFCHRRRRTPRVLHGKAYGRRHMGNLQARVR